MAQRERKIKKASRSRAEAMKLIRAHYVNWDGQLKIDGPPLDLLDGLLINNKVAIYLRDIGVINGGGK